MFEREAVYPTAVASYDDEGVAAAIDWCIDQMQDGDTLTVWTSLVSNLGNCPDLEDLVNRNSNVVHLTGRGGGSVRATGPVLMAWPHMDDIGKLVRFGASRIRALCVITWHEEWLRPWVSAVSPTILGDGSVWEDSTPDLNPLVVEALKSMTRGINHNNTISAGYEKDTVVASLLALRDASIPMDGDAMQGWALAHGWAGKNPARLAKYVSEINAGKRPRSRWHHGHDYVERLRERAAAPDEEDEDNE